MKNLFGAAMFAGMGLFVGCDTMTNDEIEKLINDKLNESSSNATADATPPVELAGTTWLHYDEGTGYYDEDSGEIIECEVYYEQFLHFTETTMLWFSKTYKKADDSLLEEWEDDPINYYVQGNIILLQKGWDFNDPFYSPKDDCIIFAGSFYYRVEE